MSSEETTRAAAGPETAACSPSLLDKLWIYTNYDCNLRCTYCVAESSPSAPRRAIGLANVRRLVDEAVAIGFAEILFTGGEPFVLDDIHEMLAHSSARVRTTVLTNATLLRGQRLDRLAAVANANLVVQVSLDGGEAADHDPYRGAGTWARAVEGIRLLRERGLRVRVGATETAANAGHADRLHAFCRELGIADADRFVRPLARRGFATEGQEVGPDTLLPELTVTVNGVYWHPLASPGSADLLVRRELFPLAAAVEAVRGRLAEIARTGTATLKPFH
jgi:MoaA/NifB/PqqE/SkfB family radical SAM enzyme